MYAGTQTENMSSSGSVIGCPVEDCDQKQRREKKKFFLVLGYSFTVVPKNGSWPSTLWARGMQASWSFRIPLGGYKYRQVDDSGKLGHGLGSRMRYTRYANPRSDGFRRASEQLGETRYERASIVS